MLVYLAVAEIFGVGFYIAFMFLGQVKALAGCDLLTISPKLLEELDSSNEEVYESLTEKSGMFVVTYNVVELEF